MSAFCEDCGLDKETALRLAGGMGSGVRSGEICGAVSGAVLVIGLKHGQCMAGDMRAKEDCHRRTEAFLARFRAENRSVVCREILGYDISDPEGYKKAKSEGNFTTTCADMVKSASCILEELGY